LAQRCGVKGSGLDSYGAEGSQSKAHFFCRAGGEGESHNALGNVFSAGDSVGDAVGDSAGLAGSGACEYAHRAVEFGGDPALVFVETREDVFGGKLGRSVILLRSGW